MISRLTLGEIESRFGLGKRLIRSEVEQGQIPALIVTSGRVLIDERDLLRWLAAHQTTGPKVSAPVSILTDAPILH